jgi:hypothetical protein
LFTKSVVGSSVKEVGPPLTVAAWEPLVVPTMVNHVPLTDTGSLKFIVILEFRATPVAPLIGVVLDTLGATSPTQGLNGELVLRGLTAAATKSDALLSVSIHPPSFRKSAVVADIVGAAPLPSKKFAPPVPVP